MSSKVTFDRRAVGKRPATASDGYARSPAPREVPGSLPVSPRKTIPPKHRIKVLRMLNERQGPMRWFEFDAAGVEHGALKDMVREGMILYPAVGIFAPVGDYDPFLFAMAVLRVHGANYFACLETAARYHGLLPHSDNLMWIVLPSNRDTVRDICGFEPVPVRWNGMRLPPGPLELSPSELEQIGWIPEMSAQEATERYCGIFTHWAYGTPIRITNPARTICDLVQFRNRPIGREGLEGLHITTETVVAAIKNYSARHDLDEAIQFAARHNYSEEVTDYLVNAKMFMDGGAPRP